MGLIAQEYKEETDPLCAAQQIQNRLFDYSMRLNAWADQIASVMVQRAANADYDTWRHCGEQLSAAVLKELKSVDRGPVYYALRDQQVHLIKTLPLEASKVVVEWTRKGLEDGDRWEDISDRIMTNLGPFVKFRADCIARTETARARSNFTQARARTVGSTHYIWHTVGDRAVRDDHVALDGTIQAWAEPPIADSRANRRAHPGCIYNCRCYPEPLFPKTKYD